MFSKFRYSYSRQRFIGPKAEVLRVMKNLRKFCSWKKEAISAQLNTSKIDKYTWFWVVYLTLIIKHKLNFDFICFPSFWFIKSERRSAYVIFWYEYRALLQWVSWHLHMLIQIDYFAILDVLKLKIFLNILFSLRVFMKIVLDLLYMSKVYENW